jgi:hypothetical protein
VFLSFLNSKDKNSGGGNFRLDELCFLKEKKELKRVNVIWDHDNMCLILHELNIKFDFDLVNSRLTRGYQLVFPVIYLEKDTNFLLEKQEFVNFSKKDNNLKVILVGGSEEFTNLIKNLKELEVEVEVWSFRLFTSQRLIKEIDHQKLFYFDDYMEEFTLLDYSNDLLLE